MNTHDGYSKKTLDNTRVLLAGGGDHLLGNATGDIPLSNGTVNVNLNADLLDGYHLSSFLPKLRYEGTSSARWFKVRLNVGYGSMFSITVKVNGGYKHKIFEINGYNYTTNKGWHAPTASCIADSLCSSSGLLNTIVFGKDGDGEIWFAVYADGYSSLEIINAHFYWSDVPADLRSAFTVTLVNPSNVDASFSGIGTVVNTSIVAILRAYRADILTTARTINGTSFNGSSNIVTSYWGTARTLTIGNSGKSVNGSANVTWTLSEIGAASTSHVHTFAQITNKITSTNEFNFVDSELATIWLNYRRASTAAATTPTTTFCFGQGTASTTYASLKANGFVKNGSDSSYVLTGDGGHKAWGNAANNIAVNNSTLCTNLNADMLDGAHGSSYFKILGWNSSTAYTDADDTSNIVFGMITNQQGNTSGSVINYPTGYGYMLSFIPQAGTLYSGMQFYESSSHSLSVRSKWGNDWGAWRTIIDSSNYTSYINNYYWANVKVSTTSSVSTTPQFGYVGIGIAPTNTANNGLLAFAKDKVAINFRPDSSTYFSKIQYMTSGNEALVFANANAVTSFIFKCGYNLTDSNLWASGTIGVPTIQMKNQSLYVNTAIANGVTPSYNFYVTGTSYFTDIVNIDSNAMDATTHINFNRASFNYINVPTSGTLAISINGASGANTFLAVDGISVYPGYHNNSITLGTAAYRWSKVYIGSANSYGSATLPIYWNAGVPTATTYSLSATIKSGTANRMAWYDGNNSITSATNIYTNGSKLGINLTSATEVLEVNGGGKFNGNVYPSTSNVRYLGTSSYYWHGAYINGNGNIHWNNLVKVSNTNVTTTDTNRGLPRILANASTAMQQCGNRFYGLSPESVTIEYTTDNGSSWTTLTTSTFNTNLDTYKRYLTQGHWGTTAYPTRVGNVADAASGSTCNIAVGMGTRVTLDMTKENRTGYIECLSVYYLARGHTYSYVVERQNKNSGTWTTIEEGTLSSNALRTIYPATSFYLSGSSTSTNATYANIIRITMIITAVGTALQYAPMIGGICGLGSGGVGQTRSASYTSGRRSDLTMAQWGVPIEVLKPNNAVLAHGSYWQFYGAGGWIAANTNNYADVYIGNGSNKNAANEHAEGRLFIYSEATNYHLINTTSTTTNYTHTLPNGSGWIVTGASAGVGSTTKPVYLASNGILGACSYTISATIDQGTANRMAWYKGTNEIASASTIYASDTALTINGTSAPANSGKFLVIGTSTMRHIYPEATESYTLGSTSLLWKWLHTNRINLNRAGNVAYGRVYYYNSTYYTWVNYMSNSAAGAAPTGGLPSTTEEVSSWAMRSIIENSSGYGWIWEACINAAASATSTKPTARMSLSSNTGRLRVEADASTTTCKNGSLIVSSALNGSSGNVAIELWRGTNASWLISNEGGNLHIRDNYTTAALTTYTNDDLIIAYNTGTVTAKTIQPSTTNTYTLGTTSLRWKSLYIGTANGYGSATQPIFWNSSGVPQACTYSLSSTVKAGTANRMAWYDGAHSIAAASTIYASGTTLTINGTAAPANSGNFQVRGTSTMQKILPETSATYDLGAAALRWRYGYFSNQIDISVETGTAPFNIQSTTKVTNLNTDLLDGEHEYTIRAYPKNSGDILFSSLPYLESSISIMKTPVVSMANAPFGKCFGPITAYSYFYSDYIAVKPGDVIYGEIWAYRASGASGSAGNLYYGIERYDRNKRPIASNSGCTYFVANAELVSIDGAWHKYSGVTTIPTSHTAYTASNVTSDGGGIYYVKIKVLVNHSTGTIPTYIGGIQLSKTFINSADNKVYINGEALTISNSNPTLSTTSKTIATVCGTAITALVDHVRTNIAAGTAGTSSATSGATISIPYVTMNAYGHVTGYGTHTHTISGVNTDEKAKLIKTTTDAAYRLLFKYTNNDTDETTHVRYAATLTYNPSTKLLKNDGPLLLRPGEDATLKIYSGKVTDAYSDGFIKLLACMDGLDGETSSYPASYPKRIAMFLQPRGGEVYIGKDITAASTYADNNYKLLVGGAALYDGNIYINTGDNDRFIQFSYNSNNYAGASWRILSRGSGSSDTNYFDIETGGSSSTSTTWNRVIRLTMDNRYVGIGTDSPSYKLHVNGDVYATNFRTSSDARLKYEIERISQHFYKFKFKEDSTLNYGFIAQELEKEHPELVSQKGEYKNINYNSALSLYIAELENKYKELLETVIMLKKEIYELKQNKE